MFGLDPAGITASGSPTNMIITIGTIITAIITAIIMAAMAEGVIIMADTTDRLAIYLCRHGETEWTACGQHTSFTDIPLTEKGQMQAVLLGKRLASIHFNKVIASPMRRATQTAELALPHHRKTIEPNAMEWNYGSFEALTRQQILEKKPRWNLFNDGAPNGESPDEVSARADHLIKMLLKESGNVAVFSHGHFCRVLAARWLNLEGEMAKGFALGVAALCILSFEHSDHVIQLWNDTSHLM